MSRECNTEALEALLRNELAGDEAAAIGKHASECATCGEELAWLRAELALMTRRRDEQPPLAPSLWDGIAARIAEPRIVTSEETQAPSPSSPRPMQSQVGAPSSPARNVSSPPPRRWHWGARVAYGGLLAAAAAALLFVAWPHPRSPSLAHNGVDAATPPQAMRTHRKLSADAALDNAEKEYQAALAVLEAQYKAKRGELPPTVAQRYDTMLERTRTRVSDARAAAGNDVDGRVLVLDGYEEYMLSLQKIVADIR